MDRSRTIRRAAFDIGSGSTKLQCSDCEVINDTRTGATIRTNIIKDLHGIEIPVQFGADLKCSTDGNLSESIQSLGISIFQELKAKAESLGAVEFHAIATEVFRRAANGQEYLDKIRACGVPVSILTQEMEAEVGFGSVQAVLMQNASPSADCVWDSGGASFQITRLRPTGTEEKPSIESYMGPLGSSISTALLVKDVQGKPLVPGATPSPVSAQDIEAHVALIKTKLDAVPAWLMGKERLASCAGANSMFTLCCSVLSTLDAPCVGPMVYSSFSRQQAEAALRSCLDRTDAQLMEHASYPNCDGPHLVVPKLSLLVAVMQHADIRTVETVKCVGSCAGVMCDPQFWPAL